MNGIVMGGGYGLAGQCRFRVACEKSLFAMPEVGIGFFPDVGSTWHLARMPDRVGFCLGVTGMSVGPADMRFIGVSTHEAKAADMAALPQLNGGALEAAPQSEAGDVIEAVLQRIAAPPPEGGVLAANRSMIARAFTADRIETVLDNLDRDGSDWAKELATTIRTRSPTSLKVTLRHLYKSLQDKNFDDVLERDYSLVRQFLKGRDFYEGIRAAVIDRDRKPAWQPATLDAVGDEAVAAYFNAPGPLLMETAA
jgi:enoyl-CoA hydratase